MRVLLFPGAGIVILLLMAPEWASAAFASHAEVGGLLATQEVRDLPVAGLTERILYLSPPAARATIVMLAGGSGDIGIQIDGRLEHDDNFVVRTRALWLELGYAVVIPDAAGTENLRGERSWLTYATIVACDAFRPSAREDHAARPQPQMTPCRRIGVL
jgi:hypothetical protein